MTTSRPFPISTDAVLSPCGTYRYTLFRRIPSILRWERPCLFCLLNPSTADATREDATSRRGLAFATSWGCTSMTFVNLFALRATDPQELRRHPDPVGPENNRHIREQLEAHFQIGFVIVAWGSHVYANERVKVLAPAFIAAGARCLGTTKDGSPRHPLYLKKDTELEPWTGVRS